MKCPVCTATWADSQGKLCPQCQFDAASPEARNPVAVAAARERFKDAATAYAPHSRISRWDVWRPWVAVVVGFLIFCLWLKACATQGRMFW